MIKIKPLKQTKSYCGPYSLKMVFDYYGKKVSIKEIAKIAKTTIAHGTSPKNMVEASRYFGFNVKYFVNSNLSQLRRFVSQGIPVIVNWFSDDEGHYSVVVKIDKSNIYFADPEYGNIRKLPLDVFNRIWFDFTGSYLTSKKDLRIRPIIVIDK